MEITVEQKSEICKVLSKMNVKIHWDHNDEMSEAQIKQCFKDKSFESLYDEIRDYNIDYLYDLEISAIKTAIYDVLGDDCDLYIESFDGDIRDEYIDYVDVDYNIKSLIYNTGDIPIRISVYNNFDCINSFFYESGGISYHDSYFGCIVDLLNINPADVKKELVKHGVTCVGKWENKKNRIGKEYVSANALVSEYRETCCGANLFTFVGTIDLCDLLETGNFDFSKITIKSKNNAGFFSSMQGGGSVFDCSLLRDITIDLKGESKCNSFGLSLDYKGGNGYSITETYGADIDFFGGNIIINS